MHTRYQVIHTRFSNDGQMLCPSQSRIFAQSSPNKLTHQVKYLQSSRVKYLQTSSGINLSILIHLHRGERLLMHFCMARMGLDLDKLAVETPNILDSRRRENLNLDTITYTHTRGNARILICKHADIHVLA